MDLDLDQSISIRMDQISLTPRSMILPPSSRPVTAKAELVFAGFCARWCLNLCLSRLLIPYPQQAEHECLRESRGGRAGSGLE
jgi:hypothetical protein